MQRFTAHRAIRIALGVTAVAALTFLPLPDALAGPPPGTWASDPAPVMLQGELDLFNAISFDSGWQPPGSPVQVRFEIYLGTGFTCTMEGVAELTWPPPLDLVFIPTPGTGELVMDLGLEVHSTYRFILDPGGGTVFVFEDEIPFLPNFDYRFADTATFDPFLLPGGMPEMVAVMDVIPDQLLYMYDITDAIVPIPGIGGGVALNAGGTLEAILSGNDILVAPEVVTMEGEHVFPAVPPAAPSLLRDAVWEGELALNGTLVLTPTIYVELLGSTWNVAAFPIPLPFPTVPVPWTLDPWPLVFPLPEIEVLGQEINFPELPLGSTLIASVAVENNGDLELQIMLSTTGSGFAPAGTGVFVLPPHDTGVVAVRFSPEQPGPATGMLTIASNDPDEATITLPLAGIGGPEPAGPTDAGTGADAGSMPDAGDGGPGGDDAGGEDGLPGGCGCSCTVVAGEEATASPLPMLLGLLMALACAMRFRREATVPRRRSVGPESATPAPKHRGAGLHGAPKSRYDVPMLEARRGGPRPAPTGERTAD